MGGFGEYVRQLRVRRGLTQNELATLSGLTRSHLSKIEQGGFKKTSGETLLALARALRVKPEELYKAAGYLRESRVEYAPPDPENILKELGAILPVQIPIVADVHAPQSEIVDYAYWGKEKAAKRNIVGLRIRGDCMEPDVRDGDVVFIDRDRAPEPGDVALCLCDDHVCLVKFNKPEDINVLHLYGVVIEVNRKLVKE